MLVLGLRPGESGFSPADRRLLGDLARQAGVAVSAVRLTADLQRSRERLVTHAGGGAAAAAPRPARRARRPAGRADRADRACCAEAHPAAIPQRPTRWPASCARSCAPRSPTSAGSSTACGRPPSTSWAWSARCSGWPSDPAPTAWDRRSTVEVAGDLPAPARRRRGGRLPDRAGGADQRRRATPAHAPARCGCRWNAPTLLTVEITDDGAGLPATGLVPGVGLSSMRERAAEMGGECSVESAAGRRVPACWPGCRSREGADMDAAARPGRRGPSAVPQGRGRPARRGARPRRRRRGRVRRGGDRPRGGAAPRRRPDGPAAARDQRHRGDAGDRRGGPAASACSC